MRQLVLALCLTTAALPVLHGQQTAKPAPPAPVIATIETAKGAIEMRLFSADAPKSVEHIVGLIKRNFYRGQRFHRVTAALVQFGDPASRDMTRLPYWGPGGSGKRIGVFELAKNRGHVRGAVALAHGGDPVYADSQLYIMKSPMPGLNGKHAVIGQVTRGMEVVDKIEMADLVKLVTIK